MGTDTRWGRRAIALLMVGTLLGACSTADDQGGGASEGNLEEKTTIASGVGEDLMWNDGPCDAALPKVPLGQIAPFNAGPISLEDQAVAAEVSAEAFNARGGISGRCIEMITCDDGTDPNKAADCARELVGRGVVAEVNDAVTAAPDVVSDVFLQAGVPRLDGAPAPIAFSAANTYTLGMGGLGNVAMTVPPLAEAGMKKLAIIRADVSGASALQGLFGPMATAYGAEIVADIPVTAGTSDFSQFILAAQSAGADGIIMATGQDETIQVLRAAQQLNTDLRFSLSLGSISRNDVAEFGDMADQFTFNGVVPPATADPTPYPLLAVAARELAASNDPELQPDTIVESSVRSWVYIYALVKMIRDAGLTDITPQTLTQMINAATDVDMGGLTPPWTPNAESPGVFRRVSMPYYWTATWDGTTQDFVVSPDQIDSVKALAGDVS